MVEFNQPLEVREYPLPDDIEVGAMLVKVEMAGICGTDVHLRKGQLPIPRPIIMGHETVGVIECLGEGLSTDWTGAVLREGDRVTWSAGMLCGYCHHCAVIRQPTRCLNRRAYGISFNSDEPPHFSVAMLNTSIYIRVQLFSNFRMWLLKPLREPAVLW